MILGIDEVGRGPWAGPLVVGAVVLGDDIEGLTDSKKLSPQKRAMLNETILTSALGCGIGWVDAEEIDAIGLSEALRLATKRAVEQVKAPYHEIIIDGTINFLSDTSKGQYVTTLAKADLLIPAVSAASIIAKVARDTYMAEQSLLYPEYGFEAHVGYGTAKHQSALKQHGITPLHRRSFAPIKKLLGEAEGALAHKNSPTSTQIGSKAEDITARYLKQEGHELLEQNWKTKYCEIDIISVSNSELIFTEVKYRSSPNYGNGLTAITTKKLTQMQKAAELFITMHPQYAEMPRRMAVASVGVSGLETYLELS